MNRTARDRRELPHPKPVKRIVLDGQISRRKFIVWILSLLIGASALAIAFSRFLSAGSGWTEIKANSASEGNCGEDFLFMYELGAEESGMSSSAENKALKFIYTQAAEKAYQLFNSDLGFEGVTNVYEINRHPNEELTVDPLLYQAFSLLEQYDSRVIYLAPVYDRYDDIFFCQDDVQIADFDPYTNEEVREEYAQIAAFANDKQTVHLELLGENKVCLKVSGAYMKYAKENGVSSYIDFFWIKNAFIVDYLAETLISSGYTRGSISSYDGFVRNLDDSGQHYAFNIYDRVEKDIYPAAVMEYDGAMSIVNLRNYMKDSREQKNYYECADGQVRTRYLDPEDGLCKSSVNNMVSYSDRTGCAEIVLNMIPCFVKDKFEEKLLTQWKKKGIFTVYCMDYEIHVNDNNIKMGRLYQDEKIAYQIKTVD